MDLAHSDKKTILVIGLGVVGLATALRLSDSGHTVYGYDSSPEVLNRIRALQVNSKERLLTDKLREHMDVRFVLREINQLSIVDHIFVCVGTPSNTKGEVSLEQLHSAIAMIGNIPSLHSAPIVLRSTIPPGTTEYLESKHLSGREIVYCPEFLRQDFAWSDTVSPSLALYATMNTDKDWFPKLFPSQRPWEQVHLRTAEFIKYMNNSYHALKVAFANELGAIGQEFGVDMREAHRVFISDRELNVSERYLKPGAPYGGACLSKDVNALMGMVRLTELDTPLIDSIEASNNSHKLRDTLKSELSKESPKSSTNRNEMQFSEPV